MIVRTAAVLLLILGLASSSAAAQQRVLGPRSSVLFTPAPASRSDSVTIHPTYWKEGALIGGIPLGIIGAVAFSGLCEMDDSADPCDPTMAGVGGAVFGFFLGAIPGALIGGQIQKK